MRRKRRDFGRLKLIGVFLFVAVVLPNVLNAFNSGATGNLGDFETGETGIKLCALINNGNEDALRFRVSNSLGFEADVMVAHNTCKTIQTVAASYTIREYMPQEYALTSVSGGTVNADNTAFITTASGQYTVIYNNTYTHQNYIHSFGYTSSTRDASAVDVHFDANGGTGTMQDQRYGINSQQALTANAFTYQGHTFDGWNTAADGSGAAYTDEQQVAFATGGELTLYAQWQAASRVATDIIAGQANDLGSYTIDFTKKAVVSNDIPTANGNGVNEYTENNQTVYYYRGQIDNNNVIWANKCWKIIRTTATGGTKIIYNGTPTDVTVGNETVKQCLASNGQAQIATTYFSRDYSSPADMGYMHGAAISYRSVTPGSTIYVFSNNVSRNGNTYTLDTSTGQSISGTWEDERLNSATRYHYFCTDGASVCDNSKIGYIESYYYNNEIYFFSLDGYDDIEDLKDAMATNTADSYVKSIVESWFVNENLDGHEANTKNYEDELEDAIFCSDRSYVKGPLAGKDVDAGTDENINGATARNRIRNAQNNFSPSLDCPNANDAFTTDVANGNGVLQHKVGLATLDEITLAGVKNYGDGQPEATENYLYDGQETWTMSPAGFSIASALATNWWSGSSSQFVEHAYGVRPVVSLASGVEFASGTGLTTDPYIVE
jgi:uncharacterized repeat protein (TIGR02543 family)